MKITFTQYRESINPDEIADMQAYVNNGIAIENRDSGTGTRKAPTNPESRIPNPETKEVTTDGP